MYDIGGMYDVKEETRNSETELTISDILKFICPMFKIILVFTQNFLIEIAYHEKTCFAYLSLYGFFNVQS